MKNAYTMLCAVAIGLNSLAQPVISNSNNLPATGSSFTVKMGKASNGPGSSGSGVSWNFNTISLGAMGTMSIINPSQGDNASSFSTATFCRKMVNTVTSITSFDFWKNSSSKLELLGNSGGGVSPTIYSTTETILKYPFHYSDNMTNSFTIGTLTFSETITYDAYGTLNIDGKTYTNVVRTRSQIATLPDTYYWWTTSPLAIVLMYSNFDSSVIFYSVPTTSVQPVVSEAATVTVYPNPANGQLSFFCPGMEEGVLTISDMQGKITLVENMSAERLNLTVAGLHAGMYVYELKDREGKRFFGRFCIE